MFLGQPDTQNEALNLITKHTETENGIFIKSLKLPDEGVFEGNICELLESVIALLKVTAHVANQSSNYTCLSLEDILKESAEVAVNGKGK